MMAKEMGKTDKMRKLFADKTLDAEQMDGVAGGTYGENADDSRFLNVLLRGRPGQPDRYGETRCYGSSEIEKEITTAWASVGVTANIYKAPAGKNHYYINGKEVTRDQAWAHAQQVVGKTLKKSDWYWD